MTTFGVWVFDDPQAAPRLQRIFDSYRRAPIDVDDAAVASWPDGRSHPLAWQVSTGASPRSLSGAFWGMLFGLTLLLPMSWDGLDDPADEAATYDTLAHVGLDAELLGRVRDQVVPGRSALFALGSPDRIAQLAAAVSGITEPAAPPTTATLSGEQVFRLQAAFGDQA